MKDEIRENIDEKVDKDDLYKRAKINFDEKIDVSVRLKENSKIYMI